MNSFLDYLAEIEQNISFDPEKETPEEFAKRAKVAHRIAGNQPDRALRIRRQNIKDKSAELKGNPNDPLANERLAIKKMEERIAKMKISLARKEDMTQARVA